MLSTHRGARIVTRESLEAIPLPPETKTYKPVAYHRLVDIATEKLSLAKYNVTGTQFAVGKENRQFFATLDLVKISLGEGVGLAIGLRSSHDKTLALEFCAGSRVFVCDNLAFSADFIASRKHYQSGEESIADDIASCVDKLPGFVTDESERISRWVKHEITRDRGNTFLAACVVRGIVPRKAIRGILLQWNNPAWENQRSIWTVYNAVTALLADQAVANPYRHKRATIELGNIANEFVGQA
jgi:hypothetical protein